MNGRRNFVKGIGLLSVLFAGSAHAGAQNANPVLAGTGVPDTDSGAVGQALNDLAPPADAEFPVFTIMGRYGEEKQQETPLGHLNGNTLYFVPDNRPATHSVHMTVGKDNRLWIKVNDEWKRVAIEG